MSRWFFLLVHYSQRVIPDEDIQHPGHSPSPRSQLITSRLPKIRRSPVIFWDVVYY
ncbi:hypothetical protein SARI_03297 [Salmonella enterica subsp. arizonae serovar 62:z4,z23:-]|uniref:Uncharacterized protein n=1 Tax=Salmonella arizonae (strain ATCC BAA-731 / CDC346-86 / RSK2980) TaxID=41514 RepID=A9MFR4_SALAR|nr:hypothetical protein SARI_03297 [Salmonella enterica subsp. arizonae serovar 62:z4,z23:-]